MSLLFEATGFKEATDVFRKLAFTPADEMQITRAALGGVKKAVTDIRKSHYWKDHSKELTNSHYAKIAKVNVIEIGATAKHALWLQDGTKDHMIRPKNATALHWKVGGMSFFSKGHMVTGINAKPWLQEALDKRMPDIRKAIEGVTKNILEKK